MSKQETITLNAIVPKRIRVTITGDSDLVLNKMNDICTRKLTQERKNKASSVEAENIWEGIITSIHWLNGKPTEFTEESFRDALINNAPCITAFGIKKALCQAVVRSGIDTYSTKFDANVNVFGVSDGLIPVEFASHYLDEKLMSPKKGSPVLVRLNRFNGWSATFEIAYLDGVYSAEQILNIINLAGFGLGIGSGRSSGYGRFHIESIE